MSDRATPTPPGSAAWEEFAARHPGSPHLDADPLYALDEGLIVKLVDHIPGLFDEADLAFERDLAGTTRGGLFFARRAIPCLLLGHRRPEPPEGQEAFEATNAAIREALAGVGGCSRATLVEVDRKGAEYDRKFADRAAAYAGWLIATPRFLAERDLLREHLGPYIEERGGFPWTPRSCLGRPPGTSDRVEAHFLAFFRRWALDTFITWDLPWPLRPEVGFIPLDNETISEAGITVFLPWYIAKDGRFSPADLADHLVAPTLPPHLKGWLETPSGGKTGHGDRKTLGGVRHRHYFSLYRYGDLALKRRYAGRLRGNTGRLDLAFSKHLGCSEDTIKKIRVAIGKASQADPA